MPPARRRRVTDRPLAELPGLGPASLQWLSEVGIETEAELRKIGAAAAYRRLKQWNPKRVSLNMLWGLHSAITGVPWNRIDRARKARLRRDAEVT